MAVTLPMSSVGPIAVAHSPTAISPAAATFVVVTVVDADVVTVTGVVWAGAADAVPEPPSPARVRLATVKVPEPTWVTRPTTPNPPGTRPPGAPGAPSVAPGGNWSTPGWPVGIPEGIPPPPRMPPPNTSAQAPFTAADTCTEVAVTPPPASGALPSLEALRTTTHEPATMSARVPAAVRATLVVAVQPTAVCLVLDWTCMVVPSTAAMSPDTPGIR